MHPKNIPHLHEEILTGDGQLGKVVGRFDCFDDIYNANDSRKLYVIQLSNGFWSQDKCHYVNLMVMHRSSFSVKNCTCGIKE